ncbi:cytochrome b N-terminal domain-containing protein [Thermodesulfobacteriota bacterium]
MPYQDANSKQLSLFQRIRYSVFPGTLGKPKGREGFRPFFNSLVLHFRPRSVPERTLRFSLTWGLGGMAVVLIFLLFGTGLLLKFVYQPSPARAYESILHLQQNVLFGQLIRNVHHWSANLLLIVAFLHFLRVFFTGAFHTPRQFNWIIGLVLFLTILLSNFTGYLLPWDQLSFWAVTICTGMLEYIPGAGLRLQALIRGGAEVGPATLSNFYALHTAILPALFIIFMPFHFWRVRKAGGLVVPRTPAEDPEIRGEMVPGIPNLILRELVLALVLIAAILMVSIFFNAPLESKANPGLSPNPTKAPWYFMGFQEILLHFHPIFALFIIPAFMAIGLISIPYINYPAGTAGVWFASSTGRRTALETAAAAIISVPIGIIVDEYIFDFAGWMPGLSPAISNGLIPFAILLFGFGFLYLILKRRHAFGKNESIQMIFVFILTAFILLTITGIWFRGSGMRLAWPWM